MNNGIEYVLFVYDRRQGVTLSMTSYADPVSAILARMTEENERGDDPDLEIVVISGAQASIRRNHRKYFINGVE